MPDGTRREQLEDLYLDLRARQRVVQAQFARESVAGDEDGANESLVRWHRMDWICVLILDRIGVAWLEEPLGEAA